MESPKRSSRATPVRSPNPREKRWVLLQCCAGVSSHDYSPRVSIVLWNTSLDLFDGLLLAKEVRLFLAAPPMRHTAHSFCSKRQLVESFRSRNPRSLLLSIACLPSCHAIFGAGQSINPSTHPVYQPLRAATAKKQSIEIETFIVHNCFLMWHTETNPSPRRNPKLASAAKTKPNLK